MINDKGKIYYGLGLDNAQLRADATEARSIIKGIGDTTVAEGNRIDGSMSKIGAAVVGAFSVQKAAEFAGAVVNVRGEIEALEKSFVVLAGHKGVPLFNEIRAFATDTTFQLGDLAKGAQTLMAFNIEADRVMPILRQIGDISMGNVDKFNSLILAFAQMSSTGKLMGQDLLQMINAGFNPLTVISDKTGKSIAQLKKEMETGGITADMVADAFQSATAAGGKTGVMNVQQMSEAVYEAVYSATIAANRASGGNGGGGGTTKLYIDGREVTSVVEKRQHERGASIMGNEVYSY